MRWATRLSAVAVFVALLFALIGRETVLSIDAGTFERIRTETLGPLTIHDSRTQTGLSSTLSNPERPGQLVTVSVSGWSLLGGFRGSGPGRSLNDIARSFERTQDTPAAATIIADSLQRWYSENAPDSRRIARDRAFAIAEALTYFSPENPLTERHAAWLVEKAELGELTSRTVHPMLEELADEFE